MTKLDWTTVKLEKGVLREPTPGDNRIVVWIPGKVDNGYRAWDRIANVPGAEIAAEQGLRFTPATRMPARQKLRGFVGWLWSRLSKTSGEGKWVLPNGQEAEQAGEREAGLLLVWPEESKGLDDAAIKARWGENSNIALVGNNLFVVKPEAAAAPTVKAPSFLGNPREQAEQLVVAARQAGDRRAEAAAMIDLGVALLRGGAIQGAGEILEVALTTARNFGDRVREYDALNNLCMVLLAAGQPMRALEPLGQALAYARETKDPFKLKLTLSNAAAILAAMRDYGEALAATEQALTLAREHDDRHHEADLLWFQAIVQAELGQRDKASALAQSAIDIHAALRSPHVAWLADHLKKFRSTVPATAAHSLPSGYYTGASTILPPAGPQEPGACDPGLLRAAQRAVKAMADTTGTGLKTVAPPEYQLRLETCAACPNHTGARCLLTGAFTRAKAWLPYEKCPIGKWAK